MEPCINCLRESEDGMLCAVCRPLFLEAMYEARPDIKEWIDDVKNQRKAESKNCFTGADITVRINKTGIQYDEIEFKLVDCECIYCGLRLNAELPFVDDAMHNFICPQCNKEFPLDLAIIKYLDESE